MLSKATKTTASSFTHTTLTGRTDGVNDTSHIYPATASRRGHL